MQLVLPRPYQMMTSQSPKPGRVVRRRDATTSSPSRLSCIPIPSAASAVCRLMPGVSPKAIVRTKKCVKEQGFVGCLLNPDPGECSGVETPACLRSVPWYPLYEKMVELDIPGHIHSTGCRSECRPEPLHFINEENYALVASLS